MAHQESEKPPQPPVPVADGQYEIITPAASEIPAMTYPDSAAFAELYQHYHIPVYQYFYRRVGNSHDAEDLTATTFTKVLISLDRYQEQGRFAAWLFSIARHTLYDAQRHHRTHLNLDEIAPLLTDVEQDPEAQALRNERMRVLNGLVRQLPPEQQTALILRLFGEVSTSELADRLGRSVAAVKMLVYRAMTTLRTQYRLAEAPEAIAHSGRSSLIADVESLMEWACGGRWWEPTCVPIVCHVQPPRAIVLSRTTCDGSFR